MAAKWWGSQNIRPILLIHDTLDNASSFDALIPFLPSHLSYLAIDLPGRGKSNRIPEGMLYSTIEDMYILNYIIYKFQWEKVSLMGHGNGAKYCFMYASTFPKRVDFVIALDDLSPDVMSPQILTPILSYLEDNLDEYEKNREPILYTRDELIASRVLESNSIISREIVEILLTREIRKHKDKYISTRDNRLKSYFLAAYTQEISMNMAKKIKCPLLFLRPKQTQRMDYNQSLDKVVDLMNTLTTIEYFPIDAERYAHLVCPQKISNVIGGFLCKHRGVSSKM